jgi:hypothetical protein
VTIRVEAIDREGQSTTITTVVYVATASTPIFNYVPDTVVVSGTSSHILSFDLKNDAIDSTANAEIHNITVTLTDNTKGPYIGEPRIMEINASGSDPPGSDPRWTNSTVLESDNNGSEIVLGNFVDVDNQLTTTITLVYANSSGDYFNVNDMTVEVKIGYRSDGGLRDYTDPSDVTFDTPITEFQLYTQTRYMRSDSHTVNGLGAFRLYTAQSSSTQSLNERTPLFSGPLTCTWSVTAYVRHSDSSLTPIASTKSASVTRDSDGSGLQNKTLTISEIDLDPTDAIVIHVYMDIGGYSYGPVTFITEQLNAEKLVAGTWNIWYYTECDQQTWRTRGIFSWGDFAHNSRIENFQFEAL